MHVAAGAKDGLSAEGLQAAARTWLVHPAARLIPREPSANQAFDRIGAVSTPAYGSIATLGRILPPKTSGQATYDKRRGSSSSVVCLLNADR